MRIGIVTFVRCGNYGAELQAYALQYIVKKLGFEVEVIDLKKDKFPQKDSIRNAIINRFKFYGPFKGIIEVFQLIISKYNARLKKGYDSQKSELKKMRFDSFFRDFINHSELEYSVEDLRHISNLPWNILITGSDQVWNFRQSKYLDVFFLKFAKKNGARTIAYAPSFGFSNLPDNKVREYSELIKNIDKISVREVNGVDIVRKISDKPVIQVLDPTLLLSRKQWVNEIGINDDSVSTRKVVIIYTITGSKYIYNLAKIIAGKLCADVINIKGDFSKDPTNCRIMQIKDAGPREFISLLNRAAYVITDSFHGTAFSINFNIPFTTLLNPVSNNNSRSISLLTRLHLSDRYIFDDGSNRTPISLMVDFSFANAELKRWRDISINYLDSSLKL